MFAPRNIALHAELIKEAEEKVALGPWGGAALGAGALAAVGAPAALYAAHKAEKEKKRTRDLSFGAGMATGAATPILLKKLLHIANERGLLPPDALEQA